MRTNLSLGYKNLPDISFASQIKIVENNKANAETFTILTNHAATTDVSLIQNKFLIYFYEQLVNLY